MPSSFLGANASSFSHSKASTPVTSGDRPNNTETRPEWMYCEPQ
jgi:hypothetical protein